MSATFAVTTNRSDLSDKERITQLETENLVLRERLGQLEMMHAISAAKVPKHTVLSALDEERQHLEDALQPHRFKFSKERTDYNELQPYPVRPHFEKATAHPSTEVVIFDGCPNDPYHPSTMPIYQTATFVQPDIEEFGPYDYSRSGNPTRTAVETLVAKLEGAHSAFAFSSGMSALHALVASYSAGDVLLASSDLYGGMHRLLTQVTARLNVHVEFVDTWNLDEVEAAFVRNGSKVKLLHIESPTNPLMRVVDIRKLSGIAHKHGAEISIDNTMMSPMRCTPLALGCDYSIHSGTKFLCGHSDTMCGIVCAKSSEGAKKIGFLQNAQGSGLSPFDSWLVLRGLKTLSIRVEKQERNAVAVALFLNRQRHVVKRLHFAGLSPAVCGGVGSISASDFDIHRSQTSGPGCVISIETGSVQMSTHFVRACKLFKLTVSFGSCNSVIEMPCLLSHASIPKEKRTLPADLIRISVGIEDVEDILADLSQAINAAGEASSENSTDE